MAGPGLSRCAAATEAAIRRPSAVYSTPTTKTPDNKDKEPGVPPHCTPFPDDGWVQVTRGEAVVGLFAYRGGGDVLFVANHNAFAPQRMVVQGTCLALSF